MPLDGHSFLISQGWSGLGTGLRQDALIRPLAIPQKRTLSGLGKDRDEAFPFWDHLFSVAAKTIQVKLHKDDDDDSDNSSSDESNPLPASNTQLLDKTSTGILSNKAPKRGTPAVASASSSATLTTDSGSSTPPSLSSSSSNLLTTAKQEAAKRILYSHFFRGPTLTPDPNSNSATTIPNTDSGTTRFASTTTDNLPEENTTYTPFPNGGKKTKTTPMEMAMAKVKMTDTTTIVVDPLNTTNQTCEAHQDRHHHHQRKRKRDKVINSNSNSDSDENVIVINTSHQQRKRERERKEERKNSKKEQKEVEKKRGENVDEKKKEKKKKEKKEKKQLKFKATHEPEEPIPRKKKRQCLDSSTLTSAFHDPAPVQDLRSEVNKKKKEKKKDKKEKTRDRDQLKGEVEEDGHECRNHEQKHVKSKRGLVPMVSEGLESKKKKRRELQIE